MLLTISFSAVAANKTKLEFDFKRLTNSPAKIGALAFIGSIAVLACKDEPVQNPMGITDGVKGFFTTNPLSKKYLQHLYQFIDEVVIGYAGKKRGFRVLSSKINYEGKPQSVAAIKQQLMNGAEEVTFYKFGNAAPYGILGTIWAYVTQVTDGLKKLKDGVEAVQWTHDVVVNNLD